MDEKKNKIRTFIEKHRFFIAPIVAICVFLLVRTILLNNPAKILEYTVKEENLVDTVTVSGTYKTASQVEVLSPANGIIKALYVHNGQQVNKGDKLFYIESTATVDQQNKANANYKTALSMVTAAQNSKKDLDATMWAKQQAYITAQNAQKYKNEHTQNPTTKNDYTDLEKLAIDNGVVSAQKDFEAAEQGYKTADVILTAAQAQVQQTKHTYDETQSVIVTAQAAGRITDLQSEIGDQVTARASSAKDSDSSDPQPLQMPAEPVLVISNMGNPYLVADISEDYAVRVQNGQKVSIVFDGLKDQTFTGSVESIATVGKTNQGIVTYTARIMADNLASNIKPNMTALITIETLRKDDVIDVPNSAIIHKDGQEYVKLVKDKSLVPVNLGIKGLAKTEITDGLSAGTIVVANPE